MYKVLYTIIIALAACLGIAPWLCGHHYCHDCLSRGIYTGVALVAVALSILGMRRPHAKYPAVLVAILGFALFIWGLIVGCIIGTAGGCHGAVIGLVWLFVALVITQLFTFPSGSAFDKSGNSLTTISNIRVKGDNIVVKAVLLGTMPSTIYMRPEEIWKLLPLIDASVIWKLPVILFRGWRRARQLVKGQAAPVESTNAPL